MVKSCVVLVLTLWCLWIRSLTGDDRSTTVDLDNHTYEICHINGQCPEYLCTCRIHNTSSLTLYCWVNVSMTGVITNYMRSNHSSYYLKKCSEQSPIFLQLLKDWLVTSYSPFVVVECGLKCKNPARMTAVTETFGFQIDGGIFHQHTEFVANQSLGYDTLQYFDKNLSSPLTEFIAQADETKSLILDGNGLDKMDRNIFNKHLTNLSISRNSITELPEEAFWDLDDLQFLNLTNNHITRIPMQTFSNNSNLKILDLSHNGLKYFRGSIFKNLTNLIVLRLEGNGLVSLPEFLFRDLKSLEYLDLSNNSLISFSSYLFQNTESLVYLNLSKNSLFKIETETFQNVKNLKNLDLSENLLSSLPPLLFENLKNLTCLNLSMNRFIEVEETLLKNLSNLQFLDISRNKLESIASKLFANNHELRVLDVSRNSLHQLPSDAFSNNLMLDTLHLSHNLFISLQDSLLNNLTKLRYLFLNGNNLSNVSSKLLEHQQDLEEIDLSENHITFIGNNAFSFNAKLSKIDLRYNELESIPSHQVNGTANNLSLFLDNNKISILILPFQSVFKPLKKLSLNENCISAVANEEIDGETSIEFDLIEEVSMVNCCLESLPDLLPINVGRLLDVQFNHIVRLDLSKLPSWESLERLNLRGNRIESVVSNVVIPNQQSECPDIEINLDGNPFVCDCNIRFLWEQLKMSNSCLHLIPEDLFCNLPASVANRGIAGLQESELQCSNESTRNHSFGQQCNITMKDEQLSMNCSNRGFREFPSNIPEIGSIVLHLEHNQIEKLPSNDSPVWSRLLELYMDDNLLSSTAGLTLQSLRKVSLKRNKLQVMNHDLELLIETNPNVTFWLNENPWNCGCEIYHLRSTLLHSLPDEHHASFQCWSGKDLLSLTELLESGLCPEPAAENGVIYPYVLAGIIPLAIICFLLVCYFKSDLKSLLSCKPVEEEPIRIEELRKP